MTRNELKAIREKVEKLKPEKFGTRNSFLTEIDTLITRSYQVNPMDNSYIKFSMDAQNLLKDIHNELNIF